MSVPARSLALALGLLCALGFPGAVAASDSASTQEVGFFEHLGDFVPLATTFRDEAGAPVTLRSLVHVPTILALVYYRCPNVCDSLLQGVAGSLKTLDAVPGTGYQVITISIDPEETVVDARKAKRISLACIEKPFPSSAWRFLTGDPAAIAGVARATGFQYKETGVGFDHPVGIMILSPEGKIVRYMYGADFLPVDLKLSLLEASQGRVGPTIARVLRICFSVDPKSHALVFNLLRIVGTVTLLAAALLIAYLVIATARKKRASRQTT